MYKNVGIGRYCHEYFKIKGIKPAVKNGGGLDFNDLAEINCTFMLSVKPFI